MNQEAYDTFWYWIKERYSIYLKKEAGLPKPWSDDPIFQTWKFCNVFRQHDRQTKALLEMLSPDMTLAETIFNIYAFRAFNWWDTVEDILFFTRQSGLGWFNRWPEAEVKQILYSRVFKQQQLTSGAYMIKGVDGQKKWESIPETLTKIWNMRHYLAERIQDEPITTMEGLQELFLAQKFYGWGEFSTYQVVLDLMYSPRFADFDPSIWCAFGPGAKRGIRCIWPEAKNGEMLYYATRLFNEQVSYLDPSVPAMTLQDIEFCLCELSKYLRIKRGGRSKVYYAGL